MTTLDTAITHWLDRLAPLGRVSARKMFGGAALYCDGQVFALLADDQLYLKVDGVSRPAFVAEGCGPFVWSGKDGVEQTMNGYHRLPDRLLDDDDGLHGWVKVALAVGRRAVEKPKLDRGSSPRGLPMNKAKRR